MTKIPATIPSAPKIIFPEKKAHVLKPNDSVVSNVTKIRWKAFSDISVSRAGRKIVHGVKRQSHQSGKKENGEREERVNHFPFRNQVHEKSCDDEGIAARHNEDDCDFRRPADVLQKRRPNHQRRCAQHGDENVKATPQVIVKIHRVPVRFRFPRQWRVLLPGCFQFAHKFFKSNIKPGTEKSRPSPRNARTGRTLRCGW